MVVVMKVVTSVVTGVVMRVVTSVVTGVVMVVVMSVVMDDGSEADPPQGGNGGRDGCRDE